MAQTIKLKRSATQNAVPSTSSLALGEIALNTYDGKLFIKKDVGGTESIVTIGAVGAGSIGPTELASTAVTAGSYGSTSAIPVITIDADGRITSASTATISGLSANSVTSTEIAANAVGISELAVTDGTDGQVLTTDGSGTLTFETPTGGAASANAFATNIANGNGSTTTFTLSSTPSAESKIIAFINGVFQNQDAYTISGTNITFDTAPISGTNNVVVYVIGDVYSGESVLISNFDGNGSTTAFTLSNNPGNENNTQVYIDGVYQQKTTYSVSGTTLTFSTAPPTGTANIEVVMLTSTTVNTPAAGSVVTASMADDSVTGAKIVSSAVTTAKIADANVTTAKIADANITTAKIANDAVTLDKIADAVFVTESEGISSNDNDTTLPTSAAVKDYVDEKDFETGLAGDSGTGTVNTSQTLTVSGTANEVNTSVSGQTVTVGLPDSVSLTSNLTVGGYIAGPASFTIDPAGVGDNTGTVVIAGNLQVDGTQTIINSTSMSVDDLNLTLASGAASAAAANGAGLTIDGASATLLYASSGDKFVFNKTVDATIGIAAQPNITSLGTLTTLTVDDITINGSTISDAGTLTVDVGGNIVLDASAGDIKFLDDGTETLRYSSSAAGAQFFSPVVDKDIIFKGKDGSSTITALTLDMSAAGAATFNSNVIVGTNLMLNANDSYVGFASNGIYYNNSADHISVKTAATIRMRIDSSGNVGIGTDNPQHKLHVKSTAHDEPMALFETNTGQGGDVSVRLQGGGFSGPNANPDEIYIEFNDMADPNNSFTVGMDDDASKLFFGYGALGTMNNHRQMVLQSDGNLALGTDTANSYTNETTFTINGSSFGRLDLETGGTLRSSLFSGSTYTALVVGTSRIQIQDDSDIKFNTQNTTKLIVKNDGNVGIGTDSPAFGSGSGLEIERAGIATLRFENTSSVKSAEITQDSDFKIRSLNSGSDIILMPTANVGIGIDNPTQKLHVVGSAIIDSSGSTDNYYLRFQESGAARFSIYENSNNIYLNGGPGNTIFRPRQNGGTGNFVVMGSNVGIDDTDPPSTLTVLGTNTADVASNGAGINGLHITRTSTSGENIYAYMTDGNAASSSWAGIGNVAKLESYGNNAFEIGSQQNIPVVIGQENEQKIRVKGDITTHAKFGSTYIESLYTPNGGVQNCRIFEDHLGKWVAVGYFAANAATSIQGTWSSVRGGPTGIGQSETTQFSADWGDSYPTEVRYMGASDFQNFNETKTIDFIHGVPVGRPWKQFFNNAQRRPDAGTPHAGTNHMGSVQGPTGTEKYGWECRGAYDGRGRWHNPGYTHHRMSDINASTHLSCPTAAFTTATSNAFNWNTYSDAKISVHHSLDYSGQDTAGYSAAFGRDDTIIAFFDDYPNSRNNMQASTNTYGTAVYVLMKLPEMQSIGLQGGRSRDHQPGEVVQTKVYERNSDVSATSGLTGEFGSLAFTPLYGNSLLEFNIHANTGSNDGNTVVWKIYKGSPSVVGTLIRRTGNQIINNDGNTDGQELPFSWTQYYQLNDDKKSAYTYRVRFSPSGATYWGHTYGASAHSYFTIKEIKQEHNATGITD